MKNLDLKKLLRISTTLTLPLAFVTSTQAILAKKRVGKSYTAQVQAEELLRLRQQVVVLDPTDAWWGLRSSADGKEPGYPITIFGGRHGDVPLAADAGAALAEAIVNEGFSAVISLKLFTKSERLRFAADFLETLYRINRKAMHLFIDEADVFAPQKTWDPAQARCLGATDEIVRRGGIDGVGITLITQRSAVLNKDVLSQVDQLVVLRMNHPKDMKPIRDWLGEHVDADKIKEMMSTLASLPRGHAWVWAPELEPPIFERVVIREKWTYDSGRSPKAGERRKEPKHLAKVDLARLGAKLAESVERVKANDPKVLRAELAKTKAELVKAKAAKAPPPPKEVVKIVDKWSIKPADLKRVERAVERGGKVAASLTATADRTTTFYKKAAELATGAAMKLEAELLRLTTAVNKPSVYDPRGETPAAVTMKFPGIANGARAAKVATAEQKPAPRPAPAPRTPAPRDASASRSSTTDSGELPIGEATTLRALIQFRAGLEKPKLRTITGYKRSSSNSYLQRLTARGYAKVTGEKAIATDAGVAAMPDAEPLPTGAALVEYWKGELPSGEWKILEILVASGGELVSNEDIDEAAKFKRSSRNSYILRLRAKHLVESEGTAHRAAAVLFEES